MTQLSTHIRVSLWQVSKDGGPEAGDPSVDVYPLCVEPRGLLGKVGEAAELACVEVPGDLSVHETVWVLLLGALQLLAVLVDVLEDASAV